MWGHEKVKKKKISRGIEMTSYAIELTLMDVLVYVVLLQQSSQDWAL